ncbi:hypothetical protein D3C80_1530370 [compost metagenome]
MAYPPALALSAAPSTSMKFAPKLFTSSFAELLTSKTCTIAPNLFAVAMACNPATPAPRIKTLAGRIVPAAVVNIGKTEPYNSAALMTALYPEREAMDDKTSIDCAFVLLGTKSKL